MVNSLVSKDIYSGPSVNLSANSLPSQVFPFAVLCCCSVLLRFYPQVQWSNEHTKKIESCDNLKTLQYLFNKGAKTPWIQCTHMGFSWQTVAHICTVLRIATHQSKKKSLTFHWLQTNFHWSCRMIILEMNPQKCVVPENIHTPTTEGISHKPSPPPWNFHFLTTKITPPPPPLWIFHYYFVHPLYPLEKIV